MEQEHKRRVRYKGTHPRNYKEKYKELNPEKYKDDVELGTLSIGNNKYKRSGDEMRRLVAELYYKKGVEKWGSRYDIVLGGGFVSIRSPGYLAKGEVTYSMVQTLFPFDNQLVLCTVKGSDLLNKFINTSNSNYFVFCKEGLEGNVRTDGTYYIVTDTYTSQYAPNNLREVEIYSESIFARDIVADYIAAGGLS